jgi:hypothetical protein
VPMVASPKERRIGRPALLKKETVTRSRLRESEKWEPPTVRRRRRKALTLEGGSRFPISAECAWEGNDEMEVENGYEASSGGAI